MASAPTRSAKRAEVDAAAGLDRLDAERDREVALAGAGRAEEVDDLVAVDEVELGERQDAVAVERGLEGEVEAGEGLDVAEPGHQQRRLDAAASRAASAPRRAASRSPRAR